MITFKIVRKIGKMLRGGAGKKEIFLGTLCGVLIGFNPVVSLTLVFAILITLLLNANVGFALLGAALGKLLSLLLSVVSFHTGYFIIHNLGLEGIFTILTNAPVTALMDLNVYAMVGGLLYAILIGTTLGIFLSGLVSKTREKMLEADQHEILGKTLGNKLTRFLLWLAFGKNKLSLEDEIPKQAPLFRKSGLILVGLAVVIGFILEFFLLDAAVKAALQSAIGAATGAEVNIEEARLSLADGKLELEGLQVADPDKLTHNLIQIDTLTADLSISDLLRNSYAIDLLSGSTLKRDVLRDKPGALLVKAQKQKVKDAPEEEGVQGQDGKALEDYFAQARDWTKYGEKACEFLKERNASGEAVAKGEKPKASKKTAVADAKKWGYLKATADLVANRPAWLIRQVSIDNVQLGNDFPAQIFKGWELSSHPAINGKPTSLVLCPVDGTQTTAKVVLRFDDPAVPHELAANFENVSIGDAIKTGNSLKIEDGKADISIGGTFSADSLDAPFTILVRDLKSDNEMLNALKQIELPGKLYGSLLSPRVKVDLGDNLKSAVFGAAKERAKEDAKKAAEKEIDKALESEEAEELKSKASDALKKLF